MKVLVLVGWLHAGCTHNATVRSEECAVPVLRPVVHIMVFGMILRRIVAAKV